MYLYKPQFLIDVTRKADLLLVTNSLLQHNIDQSVCIMSKSIIISGLSLFVCLSVCVFAFHAQTVWQIASKLGMGLEGHLAGSIGLISCARIHGEPREKSVCVFASHAQTI